MQANKIKNIFKSEFIRNLAVLVSGNGIGQGVSLLVYPILTRIYSEADFGVFSLFLSVTGLLCIISTGRYEESLVVAKTRQETQILLGISIKLLLFCTLLLSLLAFFCGDTILLFFRLESISNYKYLIAPSVFFTGLAFILSNLATRNKQFKSIASSSISMNISSSGLKLALSKLHLAAGGFIYSNLVGQMLACVSYFRFKGDIKDALLKGQWNLEKKIGLQYKAYPSFNVSRTFISTFSWNLPFLLLTGIFGETALGLFALTFALSFRPVNLLVDSLFNVMFQKIVSIKEHKESIMPKLIQFWKKLSLVLLPCFIIIYLVAPLVFGFVFGDNWKESGVYLQMLLPWVFMTLLVKPIAFIPLVFEQQGKALWIEIINLLLRLAAIYIGVYYENFNLSILLFCLVGFVFLLILLIWYVSLIRKYEQEVAKNIV